MAIINCPECGGKVSDRASACPHCGNPMTPAAIPPPVPPVPAQEAPRQGTVGLSAENLRCPNCGEQLQAKDILSSGWAHCPSCGSDVALKGVNNAYSDEGIIEKAIPFSVSKEQFYEKCMRELMKFAPEDIFSAMKDVNIARKFCWVREFGSGAKRQILPLDSFGDEVISKLNNGNDTPLNKVYDSWWPAEKMVNISGEILADAVIVPKEMSAKEARHRYSIAPKSAGYEEKDVYYCVPVHELTFTYKGRPYRMTALGSGSTTRPVWSELPEDTETLKGEPDYFRSRPATVAAIVIAAITALVIIISVFAELGFLEGLCALVVIGFGFGLIGVALAHIILVPVIALDKIIQSSINVKRRRDFRLRYEEIQERKKREARHHYNLDLDYTIPDFPLNPED